MPRAYAGPESIGKTCTICRETIKLKDDIQICNFCGSVYHHGCWEQHGGCNISNCPSKNPQQQFIPQNTTYSNDTGQQVNVLKDKELEAKKTKIANIFCASIIGIILIGLWIISSRGAEQERIKSKRINMLVASESFVDRYLQCPGSAEYPYSYDAGVVITESGKQCTVTAYVDSQNEYGALIRMPYHCVMTHIGPSEYDYRLDRLIINNEILVNEIKEY